MADQARAAAKTKLGLIKTLLEIIAIFVGASWVLLMFWVKDCPNLERKVNSGVDIQWHRTGDRCEADVIVSIENNGGRPIDISAVTLQGWWFPTPAATTTAAYFDQATVEKSEHELSEPTRTSNTLSLLVAHYPINAAIHQTFEWSFTADPSKSVYFRADVTSPQLKNIPPATTWDRICGDKL
jgi:hypothetical protein